METRLTHSDVSTPDRKPRRHSYSPVLKRSVRLAGNKTSISLENQFWNCLREIAHSENIAVDTLIERIDIDRTRHNVCGSVVRARLFQNAHQSRDFCEYGSDSRQDRSSALMAGAPSAQERPWNAARLKEFNQMAAT